MAGLKDILAKRNSGCIAKRRLGLILITDRAGCTPEILEMIREAGIGVAMGNAVEALKAEADFVTKPIGEEGIRYGLEKLGLI